MTDRFERTNPFLDELTEKGYLVVHQSEMPLLGLATTAELLDELRTRIYMDYFGGGGLGYSTVAGRPPSQVERLLQRTGLQAQAADLPVAELAQLREDLRTATGAKPNEYVVLSTDVGHAELVVLRPEELSGDDHVIAGPPVLPEPEEGQKP